MKVWIAIAVTLLLYAAFVSVARPDPGSATNFQWTATVPANHMSGAHCLILGTPPWPFGSSVPTPLDVPHLGHVGLVWDASSCGNPTTGAVVAHLYVTFTAQNRDTLRLGADGDNVGLVSAGGDWTVLQATGRFASYAGHGTYTVTGGTSSAVTLSFVGTLHPGH